MRTFQVLSLPGATASPSKVWWAFDRFLPFAPDQVLVLRLYFAMVASLLRPRTTLPCHPVPNGEPGNSFLQSGAWNQSASGWPVQQHPSHREEELPAFECTNATVMVDSKALDDTCRRHLDVRCTVHLVNYLLEQTVASLTVSLHFFGARVCG